MTRSQARHTHSSAMLRGVASVSPAFEFVHLACELGDFPVLLLGAGLVDSREQGQLLDHIHIHVGHTKMRGRSTDSGASGSSDLELLLAVSLPSSRCLVLKFRFFHLWSSCTFNHKAFFLCLQAGSPCLSLPAIPLSLLSAGGCVWGAFTWFQCLCLSCCFFVFRF